MEIQQFIKLVKAGFDVSFNYKEVFYTISLIDDNEPKKYGIGADNGFKADFDSLEAIPDFILDDKIISEIVSSLGEDEIFY